MVAGGGGGVQTPCTLPLDLPLICFSNFQVKTTCGHHDLSSKMKGIFCIEENLKSKENVNAIQEFFVVSFPAGYIFWDHHLPLPTPLNIQIVYFLEVRDIIKSHDVYLKFVFVIINKLIPFYHWKKFHSSEEKVNRCKTPAGAVGRWGGGGYSGLQVTGMIKGLFWVFLGVLGEILQNFKG